MRRLSCEQLSDVLSASIDFPYSVDLGERVEVELANCFGRFPGRDLPSERLGANPVTGPLAIEGTGPSDTIAVAIEEINPVGDGCVGGKDDPIVIPMDAKSNTALYAGAITLELAPMVGTIGVAPAGQAVDTHRAGDHGGNMDCNIVRAGATVCFNVNAPGAGLGLGDVHALMGDGEVSGQGIEAAAVARIRIRKVRGLGLPLPYGLLGDRFFIVGWGSNLEEAADKAQADMVQMLMRLAGLSEDGARRFLGIAADLRVGWRGGATPTVWLELILSRVPKAVREGLTQAVTAPL
ncbi:MAG: acetamidase/formamidase family protein [Armatimonadota bacterium]